MWLQGEASKADHLLHSPSVGAVAAAGAACRSKMLLWLQGELRLVRLTISWTATLGALWLQWEQRIGARYCCGCRESSG